MHPDSRGRELRGWWLLVLWFPFSIHAATADEFAYRYPLATDGSSAVWRVELSPAIYAVSAPAHELRDVIVVNAQGQPVPFGPLPPEPPHVQAFALKTTLLPLPANDPGRSDGVLGRSRGGRPRLDRPRSRRRTGNTRRGSPGGDI